MKIIHAAKADTCTECGRPWKDCKCGVFSRAGVFSVPILLYAQEGK